MILLVGGRRIMARYDFVTYMIIDCKIWHWLYGAISYKDQ
jgi:hypothetical protein